VIAAASFDFPRGKLALGACAFGRAIDAHGAPLDMGPPLQGRMVPLDVRAPAPGDRVPIAVPLWTGVRVLDGLLTIGRGARVGIFGAPGAGKTTLIESVVGSAAGDAIVVALVGERGREAQRWIERLDDRTTVVCATSDRPAPERAAAARVAVAQAAALRDRGLHVLLVFDSLARFGAASREIAVAGGESTGRGGYPPSVFAEMARLVEVGGALEHGSITLVATVISDGDDRDPVSDAARSLLDGHIALSRRLAEAGRFPAVDVPASSSRTMEAVAKADHVRAAHRIRRALAMLARIDDARALGIEPSDRLAQAAIAVQPRLDAFLYHDRGSCESDATLFELAQISELLGDDGDPE
jgi:ATP synthase in type III secretion protein N